MLTKVLAAKRAARSGAHTVIASGHEPDVLLRLAAGEAIGTLLYADTAPLAARKQWLADHLQVGGALVLDAGAVRALASGGKSLLPIGVKSVEGEFERGAVVACLAPDGREVARGLVNYSASGSAPHPRTPVKRDRKRPRLRGRARADPPRQSRAALSPRSIGATEPSGRASGCRPKRSASTPSRGVLMVCFPGQKKFQYELPCETSAWCAR